MLDDANKVPRGSTLRTSVCIVGAGAAGITLARELAKSGRHQVVLLESGSFEYADATQHLYGGSTSGLPYEVESSRLRFFGGSTNHWAGQSRPLDPEDFEARDWVPGSGWPFARTELDPYYEQANRICGLGPFEYDPDWWISRMKGVRPLLQNDTVRTAIFQIPGGTRFGTKYRQSLVRAKNVRLILKANVVNVRETGGRATGVDVRTLDGNRFAVDAQVVVVAVGGIENARLLLASRDSRPAGLGNDHDVVGRYFMDHSYLTVGRLALADRAPDPGLHFFVGEPFKKAGVPDPEDSPGATVLGVLALTPAAAAAARISAFSTVLVPPSDDDRDTDILDQDVVNLMGDVEGRTGVPRKKREITVFGGDVRTATNRFDMLVSLEPTPLPDSRVTLTHKKDALGMPQVDLHWVLHPSDFTSMERGVEILGREIGRAGLGRVQRDPAEGLEVQFGSHHMGTTRMHTDPAQGVVDADGQVHGVANLYIAGSSVFPNVGFSNPTLTIVALTLRLASHLDGVVGA